MKINQTIRSLNVLEKINYHFTNRCNYFCRHCFVNKCKPEISLSDKFKVIDHLETYFKAAKCQGIINLVGGEPTLSSDFLPLIENIRKRGIRIGLVTNGTNLDKYFFDRYSPLIDEIGLSVDSLIPGVNRLIGRCDMHGNVITREQWLFIGGLIKAHGIKLKINICLTKNNCDEDFSSFLEQIKPDRVKIMVLSIVSGINENVVEQKPTTDEVAAFVRRHASFSPIVENDGEMQNAYVMVNSQGMLTINDRGIEKQIKNLVDEPLVANDLGLINEARYFNRYSKKETT